MNASEPLGLPRGTVRAFLAALVVGSVCFLFATGQPVMTEHLMLASGIVVHYFNARAEETAGQPVLAKPVGADAEV